jgi:CBS domain-containing protein
MPIADVMNVQLVSVAPDAEVREAIRLMNERNVGSVTVCEGGRLVGIFTERDVLRLASNGGALDGLRMADVMTRSPITVPADADVVAVAELMGEKRVRHLPVVEGENVLGVVGIRDVLAALVDRLWAHDERAHDGARALVRRGAAYS